MDFEWKLKKQFQRPFSTAVSVNTNADPHQCDRVRKTTARPPGHCPVKHTTTWPRCLSETRRYTKPSDCLVWFVRIMIAIDNSASRTVAKWNDILWHSMDGRPDSFPPCFIPCCHAAGRIFIAVLTVRHPACMRAVYDSVIRRQSFYSEMGIASDRTNSSRIPGTTTFYSRWMTWRECAHRDNQTG